MSRRTTFPFWDSAAFESAHLARPMLLAGLRARVARVGDVIRHQKAL